MNELSKEQLLNEIKEKERVQEKYNEKVENIRHKRLHETYENLIDDLQENFNLMDRNHFVLTNKNNFSLSYVDMEKLIILTCDIIKLPNGREDTDNKHYAIYDPRTKSYKRSMYYLKNLCDTLIRLNNVKIQSYTAVKEVDGLLKTSVDIRDANLPPSYIVKFNNCIYDLKNKCEHNGLDENGKEYDFLNIIDYDLKSLDDVNQDKLNIVKEIYRLWSAGKEDNKLLLKQITFAAIQGNGRRKYFIMQSEGGDGKSSFQYMLELFASKTHTQRINLHQFDDDNTINEISDSTKLIIGDDLMSRYKVSNKAMTVLKSLVSGDMINVNVKFMPNKLIRTSAVMIQNTNTDVNFYENSPALSERIIVYIWPHYDFRSNPITDFDLDELLGRKKDENIEVDMEPDNEFMEAILAYIIHTTDYFKSFTVTKQMQENTNELLVSNDTINIFLEELKEKNILKYAYIPSKAIYEYYKDWLKINNPGAKPMKSKEFNQKLNKQLKEIGYNTSKLKRINKIERYEFNNMLLMTINDLNSNSYNKSNFYNMMQSNEPTNCLINEDLLFNDNEISEVTDILLNTEEFNKLNNYNLPLIQYAIEILSKNKLSLLANLESLDNMYLLSKDELIEKLNM